MRFWILLLLSRQMSFVTAFAVLAFSGCLRSRSDSRETQAAATATPNATTLGSQMAAANVPAKGETCLADHSEPIRDTSESSVIDPATGKSWTRVGASPDPQAVRVSLAELLAKPEQFAGRLVHVEGKVTAMCGHRRAWFAIVPEGGPATDPLRIITAPRFLVPSSSIGRVARAEGVVELRELPKATADHIAQEHGLSTPKRAIPLLKASNADFM